MPRKTGTLPLTGPPTVHTGKASAELSTIAVEELLHRPKRRMVVFLSLPQQLKLRAKLIVQGVGAVSSDRQTAALLRAVLGEGAHDHKAARLDRTPHSVEIPRSVCGIG